MFLILYEITLEIILRNEKLVALFQTFMKNMPFFAMIKVDMHSSKMLYS